jgi:hypothetical protein
MGQFYGPPLTYKAKEIVYILEDKADIYEK